MTIQISFSDKTVRVAVEANGVIESAIAELPQRPWVGLTDDEIAQGNKESWVDKQAWQSAVWWAEAKLKQKNGFAEEKNT